MATKSNGAVLYRGPSAIDGSPIVVIITGLTTNSANDKTGSMVQSWIIRSDVAPQRAVRDGRDESVCGDCRHRGTYRMERLSRLIRASAVENIDRTCYVKVWQAPRSIFECYHRGGYADWTQRTDYPELAGRAVRIGSYGDPFAAPIAVWKRYVARAKSWTGYTHQWERADALQELCMASVDSRAEYETARANGWRSFRVRALSDTAKVEGEIICPASAEGGKRTTCASCGLCKGNPARSLSLRAQKNTVPSIVIFAHGGSASKFHGTTD